MVTGINYQRLNDALEYYTKVCRFTYLDVSWLVNEEISNITKPEDRKNFFVKDKVLVASAEQSFLQELLSRDSLQYGENYVAITPCFRDEPVIDDIHSLFFMKIELFANIESLKAGYEILDLYIRLARSFFAKCGINTIVKSNGEAFFSADRVLSLASFDIIDEKTGIELGSYSFNKILSEVNMWVCGTGLAEPRFSVVLSKQ